MKNVVIGGKILTPDSIMESGIIHVVDGVIQSIGPRNEYSGTIDLDVGDHLIAPGFIDIHVHGAVGHHLMTSDREGIFQVLKYHAKHGTTGLLATTTTASNETIQQALQKLSSLIVEQSESKDENIGASILGVHLEGPYLNPVRVGAQNRECIRLPDVDEYRKWDQSGLIRMVTVAPELNGAESLIRYIRDQGNTLISAGHTDATFEEMERALAWGLSHCTHFTNAMSGFNESEPGVFAPGAFGAGLMLGELTVELIADGIHIHPQILKWIYQLKGADKIALITDAVPFCGMPEGIYGKDYGDRKQMIVKDGSVRIKENGWLAGSALTMNRAAKQMHELGVPLLDIWKMASAVPAKLIGMEDRKGKIKRGMDADLIVVDEDFNVRHTMIGGRIIC